MAIRSGFFKSVGGDRKYLAEFFTSYFGSFIGNGVFPNPSSNLQVVAGTNMTVNVRPGKGWINGYYLENDSDFSLTHIPANGTFNRIDRIVFAVNFDTRDMTIYIKQGANGATASPPALIRNSTVYELCLANVSIPAGTTTITQSLITDTRQNNDLCGIVHGTVDQVDTTTLYNQYQTYLNEFQQNGTQQFQNFLSASQQEFDDFFQALEENLSGDVAGNLQNQITALQNNTQKATTAQAQAGTDNTTIMTPLRVNEANRFITSTITDLNNLVENGKYYFTANISISNVPPGYNNQFFYVEVENRLSNDYPIQKITRAGSNDLWIRARTGNTSNSPWSEWGLINKPIATTAQAQGGTNNTTVMTPLRVIESLNINSLSKKRLLTSSDNLNNITEVGIYDIASEPGSFPVNHPANQIGYGNLIVFSRNNTYSTTQMYCPAGNSSSVLLRTKYGVGAWTQWKRLDTPEIATTAQALAGTDNTTIMTPLRLNDVTGTLSSLQTTNKTNLVSAINEVKSQANDIKTRWASVVGSPLVSTDTQAQLQTKTQTIKNTLASNITSKGVTATGTETLTSLSNKVAQIETGSISSGTVTSTTQFVAFTYTDGSGTVQLPYIEVNGLSFRPRVIRIWVEIDGNIDETFFAPGRANRENCTINLFSPSRINSDTYNVQVNGATNGRVQQGSFLLPVLTGGVTYNWEAIK